MAKKIKYNVMKNLFKKSDNEIFREGTPKPDKVEVIGYSNTFEGLKGDDYITVKSGDYHKVHAGKGKDTIIVAKKTNNSDVYGETDNDNITINGGNNHEAYGGYGRDTITIKDGFYNKADGEEDNDTIYVTGGDNHTVKGGYGVDKIYINKTNKKGSINVYGDEGGDKIYANYGNGHYIRGGEGKDRIEINAGKGHTVYAGTEDDTILIQKKAGAGTTVYGDTGTNTIKVTAGKKHIIYGGTGVDKITVGDSAAGVIIEGGAGTDIIKITGGTGHDIYSTGDKITVSKGSCDIRIGSGTNSVTLKGGSSKLDMQLLNKTDVTVTAKNGTVAGSQLFLHSSYSDSWVFKKSGSSGSGLIVSNTYTGDNITINGFFTSGAFANGIRFDGNVLSLNDIKDIIKKNAG